MLTKCRCTTGVPRAYVAASIDIGASPPTGKTRRPTPRVPRAARKGGSARSEARARGRGVAVSPVAFHGPNVTVSNFLPFEI